MIFSTRFKSFLINLQFEIEKVIRMTTSNNDKEQDLLFAEASAADKKVPQKVCAKCKAEFNQDENTCPHCGHTNWGIFILMIIIGIIVVPIAIFFIIRSIDDEGVVMDKLDFFLAIIGGVIGVVILFRGVTVIWNALLIRKRLNN
jgi:hypothetical protein